MKNYIFRNNYNGNRNFCKWLNWYKSDIVYKPKSNENTELNINKMNVNATDKIKIICKYWVLSTIF